MREAVLDGILEKRVLSSRGCPNPRALKKKMSNFPVRKRNLIRRWQRHGIRAEIVK